MIDQELALEVPTVFYWQYDDGSVQYVLRDPQKKSGWSVKRERLESWEEWKAVKNKIRETAGTQEIEFRKRRIPCGLCEIVRRGEPLLSREEKRRGILELEKLLACCGEGRQERQAVMNLVSGVLAGYSTRYYLRWRKEWGQLLACRAPLMEVKGSVQAYDLVNAVVSALAVDTSKDRKKFYLNNSSILPMDWTEQKLDEGAYLQFRGKKHRYPTQYRETSVLLYGDFFKGADRAAFAQRNRWASIVFAQRGPKDGCSDVLRISGKALEHGTWDWDGEAIYRFLCAYVFWLAKKRGEERKTLLRDAEEWVNEVLMRHVMGGWERPGSTRMETIRCQVLALALLLCFCHEESLLTTEDCDGKLHQWIGWLLARQEMNAPFRKVPAPQSEPRPEEIFRQLLSRIITPEHAEYFLFVGEQETYDKEELQGDTCWGYCRVYKPKKGEQEAFLALVFRRRVFERVAEEVAPETRRVKELFSKLDTDIPFLFAKKMRFPKSEDALVLQIQRMDFLDTAARSALMDRFPASVLE